MRMKLARAALLAVARRGEVEDLFARTAAAFGRPAPAAGRRGVRGRLREYARFTRDSAEEALRLGADLQGLHARLHEAGRALGARYRARLRIGGMSDAMAAARLVYFGIGIDFRGDGDGCVCVRRCGFAKVYSPRVCALISSMDSGLLAGLAGGGGLRFGTRITEGAPRCTALFERRAS